jgi:predicted metalloendopeptidase
MRDEALKNKIKTDPHSPGMYRAYVPLQNIDAFYTAFDIKEGDKMYVAPEDRVKIW